MPPLRPLLSAALAAVTCTACSSATPPSLPGLSSLVPDAIVGSPTEVYEQVARGVLRCWFGRSGPLKADYIYHADAEPPGKGGKAEIVIHERDRTSDNQKGVRAYRISIASEAAQTSLTTENLKLSEAQAAAMDADARRWAAGSNGCSEVESDDRAEFDANQAPAAGNRAKPPANAK